MFCVFFYPQMSVIANKDFTCILDCIKVFTVLDLKSYVLSYFDYEVRNMSTTQSHIRNLEVAITLQSSLTIAQRSFWVRPDIDI